MTLISWEKAVDYCNNTLTLKKNIEVSFLELGKRLQVIRDQNLYKDQWESFAEYCMEMKVSESTASKLINIYQTFVVQYKLPPQKIAEAGGWTVIAETLPVVTSQKKAEHWLEQATLLTRTDLRRSLHEERHNTDMSNCKHKNQYTLKICSDCGYRHREE